MAGAAHIGNGGMFCGRLLLGALATLMAGCVALPEKIAPQEQSPELYRSESCERLDQQQTALSRQLADAEDQQRAAHRRDLRVAATLGVVPILGPTQDLKHEIAVTKGQLLAIATVGGEKACRLRAVDLNDPDLRRPRRAAPQAQ